MIAGRTWPAAALSTLSTNPMHAKHSNQQHGQQSASTKLWLTCENMAWNILGAASGAVKRRGGPVLSSMRTLRTTAAHRGSLSEQAEATQHIAKCACCGKQGEWSCMSVESRAGQGECRHPSTRRHPPARNGTSAEVMYSGRASVHQSRLTSASRARQFCLVGSGYRRTTAAGPADSQVLCLVPGEIDGRRQHT